MSLKIKVFPSPIRTTLIFCIRDIHVKLSAKIKFLLFRLIGITVIFCVKVTNEYVI